MRCMRIQKTTACIRCGGSGEIENPVYRGQEMRKKRETAARSLRDVARRMELSAAYVSDLELGRRAWSPKLIKAYEGALK